MEEEEPLVPNTPSSRSALIDEIKEHAGVEDVAARLEMIGGLSRTFYDHGLLKGRRDTDLFLMELDYA